MTRSILSAIRAIVAVHAKFNRDRLLGAIDAELARHPEETPSQTEVTTVGLGGSDGRL